MLIRVFQFRELAEAKATLEKHTGTAAQQDQVLKKANNTISSLVSSIASGEELIKKLQTELSAAQEKQSSLCAQRDGMIKQVELVQRKHQASSTIAEKARTRIAILEQEVLRWFIGEGAKY